MSRILIADDRQTIRSALSEAIRDANPDWQVCYGASTGSEAVAKAEVLKPDLVVLDFAMPGLDGINAGRIIRALLPDVPVMVYTFMIFPHVLRLAKEAGIQSVIEKADTRLLIEEIAKLLASKAASGTSPAATSTEPQIGDRPKKGGTTPQDVN